MVLDRKILLNYAEGLGRGQKTQPFLLYNTAFTILEDIYVLLNHPQLILICDQCERKLNQACSVLLIKNATDRRDLCFTCFIGIRDLESSHRYYVRPNLNVSLTEAKWSVLSQLKLLNALQKYGFGNWGNIKDYLDYHGSNFTQKEIQEHYKSFYLIDEPDPVLHDYFLAVSQSNPFTPPQPNAQKQSSTTIHHEIKYDVAGYNPKRQEHLFEYDPKAEELVSSLEFSDKDTPEEVELKYQLLEEYNKRVIERGKRESFVLQHRLLSQNFGKKLLAEGKIKGAVRKQMGCYSRYLSFQESENIVSHLTLQRTLSGTIRQYMRQRRRADDPTFLEAYQAMETIRSKRSQQFYSGTQQLKVHPIEHYPGKRSLSMHPKLSCEEARKKLKRTEYFKDDMKITDVSG